MKPIIRYFNMFLLLISGGLLCSSFFIVHSANSYKPSFQLPYKQAGLTERQAAAHLLSRFTYGATPGEIDEVVKTGLEKWIQEQMDAKQPDDSLNKMIGQYDVVKLSNDAIVGKYPRGGTLLRMAVKDGVIDKDSVKLDKGDKDKDSRNGYRAKMAAYMQEKGIAPEQELFRQFINQKVLRAAYSNNQLQEVLTDFWFNHFNVSITKNQCAVYIPAYERDVIRPNVMGKFGKLLLATAQSPAMLVYLDNFSSSGTNTAMNAKETPAQTAQKAAYMEKLTKTNPAAAQKIMQKLQGSKKAQGLNENYAREVMELHTLGVDGGYTQTDVTQAARVLTGWTMYPFKNDDYGGGIASLLTKLGPERMNAMGFVHKDDFLFVPSRHDSGEKTVLGKKFGPDGGYQEGVDLLNMLAHHQSTAKFISRKLAVRFVSDAPPQSLIDKMAKTFTDKDGSIKDVLITMVSAPEFWSAASVREKTKSPFELAINAVRCLHADIDAPYQLYSWVNKMGEKKYYYQAPTGFPDKGQFWINTGALLNRMNFGLALASGRIPGVHVNLARLNNNHEPESAQAALVTYSKLIMPERNLTETIKRLSPMLNDPELAKKVDEASNKTQATGDDGMRPDQLMMAGDDPAVKDKKAYKGKKASAYTAQQNTYGDNSMLSQVVGVIIGSPEFQRR